MEAAAAAAAVRKAAKVISYLRRLIKPFKGVYSGSFQERVDRPHL